MNVSDACRSRMSVRAFRPDPVPESLVRDILEIAHRAPSGGNLQPWRVFALTGDALATFRAEVGKSEPEEPEYQVYPAGLSDPYRARRFKAGEDLYRTLGIAREDKPSRLQQFARNADFFGAPVGLFFCIDRGLGPPQWADLGMYMQTVMLLAVERGLDTCAQEYWSLFPRLVARSLQLPPQMMVFAGMALGRRDETHPVNQLRTHREEFENYATLIGF